MIPIPPLDGGRVLMGFLPHRYAYQFARIEPYGFFIVMALVMTHISDYIMIPIIKLIFGLLGML
jgi:Zn-dependent protease